MADVPDQFVIGGIKDVMQCDRQFDHPEACPQMTARDRDRVDRLRAQFIGNLSKVPCIDTAQIVRALDRIEDVGGWVCQELIVGRRHALTTFPLTRRRLCFWQNLSKYLLSPNNELCRLCHEVSQLASINAERKSSARKELIILRRSASGGDLPVAGRQHLVC